MGRSPLVRRPIRAQISAQDVPGSPFDVEGSEKITFPRRFPRLGREFQARIARPVSGNAAGIEQAPRPPPDLMSVSYPHISKGEENFSQRETNVSHDVPVAHCGQAYGIKPADRTTRGGLLLHRPSDEMERFQQFVQPLFQSDETPPPPHATEEAWTQRLIHLHSNTSPKASRNRIVRAGCPKRKRVEENMVWGLERMLHDEAQQKKDMAPRQHRIAVGEDDSCALEYLHRHHNGNVDAAELTVLVDVSAGRATKVRKCLQKKLTKDRVKLPPPSSSESWRKIYERTVPSLLGQVQGDSEPSYPIRAVEVADDFTPLEGMEIDLSSDADDLKGAWRSALACGKSLERQLTGDTSGTKKPLLSTVVSFIRNAYGLPLPETCFGTQHVMIEELSNCLLTLLNHVDKARQVQAMISDALYDESGEGVDVDALQKCLDTTAKSLSIRLDEADILYRFREVVTEWEGKVESILASSGEDDDRDLRTQNDLERVLQLTFEAEKHGFVTKSLVQLKSRIRRAHQVCDRIEAWKESCRLGRKNSTRLVSTLVRDANRLKLVFPELTELMEFHRLTESWVDRANIAVRSRISLSEMKSLIERGESMPLDLSDYLEKLKARVAVAEEWISRLEEMVPCPKSEDMTRDNLAWMKKMREALSDEAYNRLHELSSEGSRIPVDVEPLKLLQVELDAKNWAVKAKKWIPVGNPGDCKKGKLEDIREHVGKAQVLRDKLPLSEDEKKVWVLDGETELQTVVEAADNWLEEYKPFLEGDNRRSTQVRPCVSIIKLRRIVEEGNMIHANLGNATSKISRILAQAEAWYEEHGPLVVKCNLDPTQPQSTLSNVNLPEMTRAVESASSNVALDLDEAIELKKLMNMVQKWFDRAGVLAPKRTKRHSRTQKAKVTVEDLIALIEEASKLPVNTQEEVKRLQMQLGAVQTWISRASHELERIASGFQQMRENINVAFGLPNAFSRDRSSKSGEDSEESHNEGEKSSGKAADGDEMDIQKTRLGDSKEIPDDQLSQTDSASTAGSEQDAGMDKGDANVHRMIKDFRKGANDSGVVTAEAELSEILDTVSRWVARSVKYLDTPREVFDKRFFGAFDRFVNEGKDLVERSRDRSLDLEQKGVYDTLSLSWGGLVSDQLVRLEILCGEREHFTSWCDSASQLLADEKKLTVEKLKELAEQSRDFPALSDMVQRVRGLSVKVGAWVASTKRTIQSGKKLSLQEAKSIFDVGEKLNVNCHELRVLRAALRSARGWANRVKRCNLEQGSIHVNNVKELIKEHSSFLIEMPEELSTLKQATRNYCICRRPYDGFMIGCDECDEWYHGTCIGVSESRADRFDKYVCTRCSISNVFKNSASAVVGVIRKWTSKKDLKKARQVESQKHQRKVRKENKDIEKLRKAIKLLETKLAKAPNGGALTNGSESEECAKVGDMEDNTDSAPSSEKSLDGDSIGEVSSEGVESQLRLQKKALQLCTERLADLAVKATERKQLETVEVNNKDTLRKWCLRVRSLVIVPSSNEQAQHARPLGNGSLSGAMCMVIGDAQKLGIEHFPDVDVVINAFKCMSWSLFTLAILRRKPSVNEMNKVVSLASALKLPEEKGLRTMKSMLQRALQGQSKVLKALAPRPDLTRPYKPLSVDLLKELSADLEEIPLQIPESARLQIAILDKGARHCVCAAPSDGSFMLCCDKCELWFHGHCVGITTSEGLNSWLCAECLGEPPSDSITSSGVSPTLNSSEVDYARDAGDDDEEIPHAPNPTKMWPPFGLFGSEKATEALGECATIPDDACIGSPAKPILKLSADGVPKSFVASATEKPVTPCKLDTIGPTAATPKLDTMQPTKPSSAVDLKAVPSGTPRKTYKITESGMIQLVIEYDPEPEPEPAQPDANDAMAEIKAPDSTSTDTEGSSNAEPLKPSPEPMEVESQHIGSQPVKTAAKFANEVVAMDVDDSSSDTKTKPAAIDIANTRGEARPNGLHASTSFAEVSIDQSSATTEGRGSAQTKDEESSSGTDVHRWTSSKNPMKESFASTDASAGVSEKMDTSTARAEQMMSLPLGMRVEVMSSRPRCETHGVGASVGTNYMGRLEKNDAEPNDEGLNVLAKALVAVKEAST